MTMHHPRPFEPAPSAHAAPDPITARAETIAGQILPLEGITPVLEDIYLVKKWLHRGAFSVIYGESNVGKTFLALDLAFHIAANAVWHGERVSGGPVVYIAGEGGAGIRNRVEAIRRTKPKLAEAASGRFFLLPAALDLHGAIDADAMIAALGATCAAPAIIVVDTLARAMGAGDENTAKDMGQFVASVTALQRQTGAHVLVIHHSGKDASKGARGSGSLRAATDTEIELARNGAAIVATAKKQRDMLSGNEFAYRLVSVTLGQDQDGEPITCATIERVDAPPPQAKQPTGQAQIALQAFGDALAAHGEAKRGSIFPTGRQCVSLDRWRAFCDGASLSSGDSESANRKAFHDAKRKLQESGVICIADGFAWRVSE